MNLRPLLQRSLLCAGVLSLFLTAGTALAAKPQLDNGIQIDQNKPYDSAQELTNVYSDKAVYGKLDASSAVDIYKFTPDKDGEQTFSVLGRTTVDSSNQPLLVLLDKTTATTDQALQLPLPSSDYHTALVTATKDNPTYYEPLLLQRFNLLAQQNLKLKKGTTYYLVVIQPYGQSAEYALKTGTGKAWKVSDLLTNPGTWFRLQTDSFSGSNPFSFTAKLFAFIFLLLGLAMLLGIFIIENVLVFLANRQKAAGYLLVKLQVYSRFIIWIGLWFFALGAFMHFDRVGWIGVPFVMGAVFVALLIVMGYHTILLSPQIRAIEVSKREATLPDGLRKRLYVTFGLSLVSLSAITVLLSMYLIK
ncbi:MAG: hypothetical protein WCO52_04900 [bacterium]